jgi:hypothetical protein
MIEKSKDRLSWPEKKQRLSRINYEAFLRDLVQVACGTPLLLRTYRL